MIEKAARTTDHTSGGADEPDSSPSIAELQADIERTRADLADTVDQLTAKLDVKSRVQGRARRVRDNATHTLRTLQDRATDDNGKPSPATLGAGGVVAAGVVFIVVVLWRRNATPRRTKRPRRR